MSSHWVFYIEVFIIIIVVVIIYQFQKHILAGIKRRTQQDYVFTSNSAVAEAAIGTERRRRLGK